MRRIFYILLPLLLLAGCREEVTIFLPELENSENEGIEVDQFEHVTLANETGEENFRIKRGEYVDVPVPVFIALKDRYPKL
jgi:hypothetical protein